MNEQLTISNNTAFDYPKDTPVHVLIENIAAKFPNKEAIRFNGVSVTYREMNEAANQFAAVLLTYDIQPGDTIGLSVDRSHNMIIALLAILKTGAAYIPLDPEYPDNRINLMLEDAGAKLLLTAKKYKQRFTSITLEVLIEDLMYRSKDLPVNDLHQTLDGHDLAYMIYTSGSTGKPKGVMLEHHNLVNFLYSMLRIPVINERDRFLAVTTVSFDIAALEIFLPLITGATVVLADATTVRDGRTLLELVNKENITAMQATPVTWKMMLVAGWEEKMPLTILCGGEALSPELATQLIPRVNKLYNLYGPTETTVWSTATTIDAGDMITIGKPIGNTQVYILDEEKKIVPAGEAGEIYIGGEGVARGYKDLPALTAEKFVEDTFAVTAGKKMYRTGDLGRWTAEGNIYFMGRIDQQIKIRGYRIEPGEIETALLAQAGTRDVVVIAREDTPGNKILVAYIIPAKENFGISDDVSGPVESWKNALQQTLPDFMVPHAYVMMKEFPLLPNGKVNRGALPKPEKHSLQATDKNDWPQTDMEKRVARTWAAVLEIDKVGIDEDFFDLGGHSLIAVEIMTILEKETGKRLPIAALFEASTVRKMAAFIETGNISSSWGSLVPVKPTGTKPPLYIIHGDGLNVMIFNSITRHMDNEQPVFGLQPKGLNGTEKPDETIEDIAAYYITQITKHNPSGPYFLAGYSFGGIVAFEMARQLESEGRKVKLVAMFDTNVGNIEKSASGSMRIIKKIALQFPKMLFILRSFIDSPVNVISYQSKIARRKWNAMFAKEKIEEEDGLEKLSPHEKEMILAHRAAYEKYIVKKYSGRIDLFRVKKRIYFVEDPLRLGWKPFAKEVCVHDVPGDHRTFLLPPNDKIFANILQSVINERIKAE